MSQSLRAEFRRKRNFSKTSEPRGSRDDPAVRSISLSKNIALCTSTIIFVLNSRGC